MPLAVFVKANVPAHLKQPRKKRAPQHNHARRLEPPTQVLVYQIETCPACHGRLSSPTLARKRHVIDVPLPPPIQVIEHQVHHGSTSRHVTLSQHAHQHELGRKNIPWLS